MAQLVISIKCDENLKPVKTRYEVAAHLLVGDKPSLQSLYIDLDK